MAAFPTAFGESRPELGSEGLGSSTQGSQPDPRRIVELPAPADFLSLSSETKPKLMTPDAFMTPSTSLQQVCWGRGWGSGQADQGIPHLWAMASVPCLFPDRCVPQQQQQLRLQLQLLLSYSCVCHEQYVSCGPLLAQVKRGSQLGEGRGWCQALAAIPQPSCYQAT